MHALIESFIERLIRESTPERPLWNIESIRHGKKAHWNYIDGCMITSLMELYKVTSDRKYLDFSKRFIDHFILEDGSIRDYRIEDYNVDDICEGRVLFDLYDMLGDPKYLKAIAFIYHHVDNQPRTDEGNFWHKKIYPNQVWLDGLFMAQPFYARYAHMMKNEDMNQDILHQFENVRKRLFDPEKQLYKHGYDSTRTIFWADPVTGQSKHFWLRAMGWFMVAIVDVLSYMNTESSKRLLKPMLMEMVDGILKYQDPVTRMFYQVVDMKDAPGNYLETSGSALIAYAIMKGTRIGALDRSYQKIGLDIFDGIVQHRLTEKEGQLHLSGICLVAGLGPESNTRRDGSYAYYISEPIVDNDAKGVGPLIMAYTEVIR